MSILKSFFEKYKFEQYLLGFLRIAYGFEFLWAFLDKLLGLGISTAPENSFLAGASPTEGFLLYATNPNSPFAVIFNGPDAVLLQLGILVDFAYMGMLLVGGVTLITGIGVRIGGFSTAIFFFSVWLSSIPPENNPILEAHFLQMWILIFFAISSSGYWLGLGERWYRFLESTLSEKLGRLIWILQ